MPTNPAHISQCEIGEAILISTEDGIATYRCSECSEMWEQLAEPSTPRDRYVAALSAMSAAALLDDLESCARQNSYGSHEEQASLVRAEILRRLA
jgi:hypothetical protein